MMRWAALVSMALWCAPAFAADYDVSATGRCVYVENGVRKPVPGARVELRDQDWDVPDLDVVGPVALDVSGNDVCGTAVAGADGRFSIRGRCGDFGPSFIGKTKPDLYVRCKVQGSGGRIFASSFPWTLYNTASRPRDDSAAPLAAGDVVLPAGPAKTFLALSETYAKIKSLTGASLLPVWVMYPGGRQAVIANTGKTYFASYAGTVFMSIAPGDEANGTVAHEYGHTLQFQSYLQDWSTINSVLNTLRAGWEAIRHPTGGGHTYSTKSNPVMAFAEGWAEFIEGVVYGSGLPDCTRWKEIGANEADRIQVEGNIACRLFRLFKKWGFKDIWTAQTRSKAARYDHFFAEYKKIHPDAASVATPAPVLLATTAILAAPLVLKPVAPLTLKAPVPLSTAYTEKLALATPVREAVRLAEGPACGAVQSAYARQAGLVARACAQEKDPAARSACEARAKELRQRGDALRGFCPKLKVVTKIPGIP